MNIYKECNINEWRSATSASSSSIFATNNLHYQLLELAYTKLGGEVQDKSIDSKSSTDLVKLRFNSKI